MHLHNLFSVFFLDYLNHGFELKELIFDMIFTTATISGQHLALSAPRFRDTNPRSLGGWGWECLEHRPLVSSPGTSLTPRDNSRNSLSCPSATGTGSIDLKETPSMKVPISVSDFTS